MGIFAGNFLYLGQQSLFQCGRFQSQAQKSVIGNVQFVFVCLIARIGQITDGNARQFGNKFGQIADTVGFRHLI